MELRYLKLIKTIAEKGNIADSSDCLFLTQSAISHQLKDIEERLGFKVFIRSRNKWKLTAEGVELYNLSVKVLSDIEAGLNKIQKINEQSNGKIILSTECFSFYYYLPEFLQKMQMLYPETKVELKFEATHDPISRLLTNEIDLALVTVKQEEKSLTYIELFEDEIFVLIHEENRLAAKEYIEAADFETIQLLIHSFPLRTVSVYEHFLKLHNVQPQQITPIPLTEITLKMIEANMGITCKPKWALSSFKLPDRVILKKIGQNGLKRKHYAAIRTEDKTLTHMKNFVESLTEEFIVFS